MTSATRKYWLTLQGQITARGVFAGAEARGPSRQPKLGENAYLDYDANPSNSTIQGARAVGGPGIFPQAPLPGRTADLIGQDLEEYRASQTYDHEHFRVLGVASAYVLLQLVTPFFPNSTRAWPSDKVLLLPSSGNFLRAGDRWGFPLTLNWKKWDRAIVPVLSDPAVQAQRPLNKPYIRARDFDNYTFLLERYLVDSFRAAGFLPPA